MVLVHGLGEHSGRLKNIGQYFVGLNFLIRSFDLPGHGQSSGPRGHCADLNQWYNIIDVTIKDLQESYPDLPLYLYGQSMGGNLVLTYLIKYKPCLNGVIITSPWIKVFRELPSWLMFVLRKLQIYWPTLSLNNQLDVNQISRDPAEVKAYKEDKLVHNKISLSLGIAMSDDAILLQKKHSSPINILLMHGEDDRICLPLGSEIFVSNFEGDITYKTWPNARHELHHDPDKNAIFEYVETWIDNLKERP